MILLGENMSKVESSFSLKPSNAYLYSFLVIIFIINLIIFTIAYFLINPIIESSQNANLYSQIFWASLVFLNFLLFAITYASINAFRYWVDYESFEIINSFRPKKKRIIKYSEVDYIKIRKIPLISDALDFGTIVFIKMKENGKGKTVAKFLGIKHAKEIILELVQKLPDLEKGKKMSVDELLA